MSLDIDLTALTCNRTSRRCRISFGSKCNYFLLRLYAKIIIFAKKAVFFGRFPENKGHFRGQVDFSRLFSGKQPPFFTMAPKIGRFYFSEFYAYFNPILYYTSYPDPPLSRKPDAPARPPPRTSRRQGEGAPRRPFPDGGRRRLLFFSQIVGPYRFYL